MAASMFSRWKTEASKPCSSSTTIRVILIKVLPSDVNQADNLKSVSFNQKRPAGNIAAADFQDPTKNSPAEKTDYLPK
jgi:hypothetical protein